jgi:nitroreductase
MDFIELAKKRYSVRKFKSMPVEDEKLKLILEAGRVAPTAADKQPHRVLVIRNDEALSKLKDCTGSHFNAPLALLVCYNKDLAWTRVRFDQKSSGDVDASIVATHMMLQAADIGIGSTWVMHFDPGKIREAYNIPDNIEPVALLPMGYPADDAAPSERHFQRLGLEETVVYDAFR